MILQQNLFFWHLGIFRKPPTQKVISTNLIISVIRQLMIIVYIKLEVINNVSFCKVASAMDVLELFSRALQANFFASQLFRKANAKRPRLEKSLSAWYYYWLCKPTRRSFIFSFFLKEMENSLSHKKDATNLLYKIYKLI